jgi:calcineurin-like phosphoesterase family protein
MLLSFLKKRRPNLMKPNEFITADTHFSHRRILELANRPFESIEEMDETLIEHWNAKVPKHAVVYHLGDFCLGRRERVIDILMRLNGRITLLKGNHDRDIRGDFMRRQFDRVLDYLETKTEDGTKVVMSHYAHLVWNKSHYGSWMLHGHSHNSLPDTNLRRLDVGVDAHPNYEPFSYYEIVALMQGRGHTPVDHHK